MQSRKNNLIYLMCFITLVTIIPNFTQSLLTSITVFASNSLTEPILIQLSPMWTKGADMITPRTDFTGTALNDKIYIIGGFNNNERYNPNTDKWTKESPMPTARHGLSAITIGDRIYVIGGGPEPGLIVGGVNEIFHPGDDNDIIP